MNFGIYNLFRISILIFSISAILFYAKSADASFIVQAPKYIGLANGLVGYWSFDGGSPGLDRSGNGNHGALTNGPKPALGKLGQALDFAGGTTHQRVDVGNASSLQLTGAMTLSAWIKQDTSVLDGGGTIISKQGVGGDRGWKLYGYDDDATYDGVYCFEWAVDASTLDGTPCSASGTLKYGVWTHIVVVFNPSVSATIYKDGSIIDQDTTDIPSSHYNSSRNVEIGDRSQQTNSFDGLIDDVRIYNRALSADEIKRLYKIGATLKINTSINNDSLKNGLVGYWSFDGKDMAGNIAFDRSPPKTVVENYTTAGTTAWVAPEGTTSVQVELWGGGGAGGGLTTDNCTACKGGGGAGGQYAIKQVSVTPGNSYNVVVAATRAGGTGNGSAGNDSTFDSTTVVAKGGAGGTAHQNGGAAGAGSTSSGVGDTVYTGGNGSDGGDTSSGGAGGGGAGSTGGGGNASGNTAGTGTSENGGNGGAGRTTAGNGNAGSQAGGGGGGAFSTTGTTNRNGGTGAAGRARLTYTTTAANNGTLTNSPTRTIGKIGQALNFDGVDDKVTIDSFTISAASPWTMGGWVKINSHTNQWAMFSFENAGVNLAGIGVRPNVDVGQEGTVADTFSVSVWNGSWFIVNDVSVAPIGVWKYVVATYDLARLRLFVDGQEINSVAFTAGLYNVPGSSKIGEDHRSNGKINGILDDLRIYNRALAADEIKRLYRIGATLHVNTKINNDSLANGLVGYWPFDGGSPGLDRSGNGNNGTLTNGPKPTIGKLGQALSFDGVNDYVNTPVHNLSQFSFSFWLKSNVAVSSTYHYPLSNGQSTEAWNFIWGFPDANFQQAFAFKDSIGWKAAKLTTALQPGIWYFIVGTADGSNIRAYLNGLLETTTSAGSPVTAVGSLNIGTWDNGDSHFPGLIDDVRIYNRALSADEIKRLYNLGR